MFIQFRSSKEINTYKVQIEARQQSSNNLTSILSYICEVKKIGETFNGIIVNFKRKNTTLNNTPDNDPIEEVLLKLGETISDLDLEISVYGEILKIKNLKKIQEEWKSNKFKITKTYFGKSVDYLVEGTEQNVMNETVFFELLSKDPFFYSFLNGIYAQFDGMKYQTDDVIKGFAGLPNIQGINHNRVELINDSGMKVICETNIPTDELTPIALAKNIEQMELQQRKEYTFSNNQIDTLSLQRELFTDGELSNALYLNVKRLKN